MSHVLFGGIILLFCRRGMSMVVPASTALHYTARHGTASLAAAQHHHSSPLPGGMVPYLPYSPQHPQGTHLHR
jgi:hypothetical protein